jgi:hypothetical protein
LEISSIGNCCDVEEEEQIRWGADLSDDEKSHPHGPCKLAGRGRRSPGSRLGRHRLGGEKNKQWSKSILKVTPYTTEPGTSEMSHGSIGHVQWCET